jgi:hypothetical protein
MKTSFKNSFVYCIDKFDIMKKSLFILAFLFALNGYGQAKFKGLNYGMSKSEAKKEFKANKDIYTKIDLGDGVLYRIYQQNFIYDKDKLVGITFNPKGKALGQDLDNTVLYLTKTRSFFESIDFETYIENELWNAPVEYIKSESKWGLALNKKDKTTMVQMFPMELQKDSYLVKLVLWHHETWVGYVEAEEKRQKDRADKSGF